jgi:hypothetical protein
MIVNTDQLIEKYPFLKDYDLDVTEDYVLQCVHEDKGTSVVLMNGGEWDLDASITNRAHAIFVVLVQAGEF